MIRRFEQPPEGGGGNYWRERNNQYHAKTSGEIGRRLLMPLPPRLHQLIVDLAVAIKDEGLFFTAPAGPLGIRYTSAVSPEANVMKQLRAERGYRDSVVRGPCEGKLTQLTWSRGKVRVGVDLPQEISAERVFVRRVLAQGPIAEPKIALLEAQGNFADASVKAGMAAVQAYVRELDERAIVRGLSVQFEAFGHIPWFAAQFPDEPRRQQY